MNTLLSAAKNGLTLCYSPLMGRACTERNEWTPTHHLSGGGLDAVVLSCIHIHPFHIRIKE